MWRSIRGLMGADEEGTLERLKVLRPRAPQSEDRRAPGLTDAKRVLISNISARAAPSPHE
jgi:hypothetical protein